MSYTRGQFCTDLLKAIGNHCPEQEIINFMLGWSIEESGHSLSRMAAYNLWNTTLEMPGSTRFNDVGVQNYFSYQQGIQANANTLQNGLYASLLKALAENDVNALGVTGITMSAAVQGDLSMWVHGRRDPVAASYIQTIVWLARNPGTSAHDLAPGHV